MEAPRKRLLTPEDFLLGRHRRMWPRPSGGGEVKITVEMSMEEVAIVNEALEGYDGVLAFNESAVASTPQEKLEASRKRQIIRQIQYRKEG